MSTGEQKEKATKESRYNEDMELRGVRLTIVEAKLTIDAAKLQRPTYLADRQGQIEIRQRQIRSFVRLVFGKKRDQANEHSQVMKPFAIDTLDRKFQDPKLLEKVETQTRKAQVRVENGLRNHARQTQVSDQHLNPQWQETFEFQRNTENFFHLTLYEKADEALVSAVKGAAQARDEILGEAVFEFKKFLRAQSSEPVTKELTLRHGEDVIGTLTVSAEFSYQPVKRIISEFRNHQLTLSRLVLSEVQLDADVLRNRQLLVSVHVKSPQVSVRLLTEPQTVLAGKFSFTKEMRVTLTSEQLATAPKLFFDVLLLHDVVSREQDLSQCPRTVVGLANLGFDALSPGETELPKPLAVSRFGKLLGKLSLSYEYQPAVTPKKQPRAESPTDYKYLSLGYQELKQKIENKQKLVHRFRSQTNGTSSQIMLPKLPGLPLSVRPTGSDIPIGGKSERFKDRRHITETDYQQIDLHSRVKTIDEQLKKRRLQLLQDFQEMKTKNL